MKITENNKQILERVKYTRLIFVLAITLLCSSCVSLKTPKRDGLVPMQAPMSIGKYPVSIKRTVKSQFRKDTVIPNMIWYYFKNSMRSDSLELAHATHIELRLTDKKHLTAMLYDGDLLLKTEILKGRLRKGYFRRKDDLSVSGVPPFYWTMSSSKIQVGIGKEGQLYIDAANETGGSFLLFAAGTPGFTQSLTVPAYEK